MAHAGRAEQAAVSAEERAVSAQAHDWPQERPPAVAGVGRSQGALPHLLRLHRT